MQNFLGHLGLFSSAGFSLDDDHTRSLVGSVFVVGHTRVLARIFWFASDDLHGDNTVGSGHGVFVLAEFSFVFVPFDCWEWLSTQTAEELASVTFLHDTRTE